MQTSEFFRGLAVHRHDRGELQMNGAQRKKDCNIKPTLCSF